MLGVSRNPVREAVRRLQQDGLIRSRPRYGIYVAQIPADEVEDVYLIRAALEGTAAGLAAQRMTEGELAELQTVLEEQREAAAAGATSARRPISVAQADRFHRLIHQGAHSPRLVSLLEQIYAQVMQFRKLTLSYPGRAVVSAAGHRQVYEALRARDGATAERLMRGHVDGARLTLMEELAEIRPSEVRIRAVDPVLGATGPDE